MKVIIIFATTLFAVNALTAQEHWTHFKVKHSKNYKNVVEEEIRFEIFQNNLKTIEAHNAKYEAGLKSYTMGVNKFADMTSKEFGLMLKLQNGPRPSVNKSLHVQNPTLTVPESIDWRQKNAVLKIKDQGDCGSCWAFSAIGAIEGQNAILNDQRVALSEQQLVDCSTENAGCLGGIMQAAFEYVIASGVNSEADYPYEGENGECRAKSYSVVTVKDMKGVTSTESALKEAVGTVGPISVGIYAEPIQFYESGIFEESNCYNIAYMLDHGVVNVGYGTDNGKKYWIIKNSWGSGWGESGFFRLARDADQCGIALDACYPIL